MPAYLEKVGRADRIRIKAAHSLTMAQISTLMEEMRPAVIIIDMVANIRGGTMESEHQNLEAKWQELRILGCENDCAVIGTMQLSLEGYNLLFPPLTAMKQSKIGVQGALDLAIMMGCLDRNEQPHMQNIRGISTPKNKMALSGKESLLQFEVAFEPGRCKFNEYYQYTGGWVGPGGIIGLEGITKGGKGQIKGTGYFTFGENKFALVTRPKGPLAVWDLEYAKQLRYEAEVAVCRYNKYLQQQPQMQPIVIQ